MSKNLILKAGVNAYQTIKENGLHPKMIKVIPGAAGGPKWLVLNRFDRMLFTSFLKNHTEPIHLIGSSIGAWRFACMCQSDPLEAQARFEESYIHQTYSRKPSLREITTESFKIMNSFLSDGGINEILNHPRLRLSFLAVRCRNLLGSDSKALLVPALLGVYAANLVNRNLLSLFFRRILFTQSETYPGFLAAEMFPADRIQLTPENFKKALLSSGSIPVVMQGIRDIPGTSKGTYRDGGVVDYHLDLPYDVKQEEIVFYPHFTHKIVPGWLDKALKWRKPRADHMKNVLMVAPSDDYISRLPNGKIPDRNDFKLYLGRDRDRFKDWKTVVEKGQVLADEFEELILSGKIKNAVTPL